MFLVLYYLGLTYTNLFPEPLNLCTPGKQYENAIVGLADGYGISNLKIERVRKGLPDRLFVRRFIKIKTVVIFAVEFKDLGQTRSTFQKDVNDAFTLETGVPVYEIDNMVDFQRIIHDEVYGKV